MVGIYLAKSLDAKKIDRNIFHNALFKGNNHMFSKIVLQPEDSLVVGHSYWDVTGASAGFLTSKDKNFEILLHGEIYNCKELANTLGDWPSESRGIAAGPEIIANGIEKFGIHFIEKLNGSFFLVVRDIRNHALILANDRYGLRPHYYIKFDGRIYIAPSVGGLLAVKSGKSRIDRYGLAQFLLMDQPFGSRTLIEDIKLLPPASLMKFKNSELVFARYWDWPYTDENQEADESEIIEELVRLLLLSVSRRVESKTALGVPLSGGLDSRVLALGAATAGAPFNTFTFGNPKTLDRRIAAKLAKKLNTEHHELYAPIDIRSEYVRKCVNLTDGMSNLKHFHCLQMLSEIKETVGVVLDGIGGNPLSGDHIRLENLSGCVSDDFANRIYTHRFNPNTYEAEDVVHLGLATTREDFKKIILDPIKRRISDCNSHRKANVSDYIDLLERQRRLIISGNILLRSVAEVRTPFFDYDLVDFITRVPPEYRFNRRMIKQALIKMAPELSSIGYTPFGIAIDSDNALNKLRFFALRLKSFLKRRIKVHRFHAPTSDLQRSFENSERWVSEKLAEAKIIYGDFLNLDFFMNSWKEEGLKNVLVINRICGVLTFDIWYQSNRNKLSF